MLKLCTSRLTSNIWRGGWCHYHPQSEQQQIAEIGERIGDNEPQWLARFFGEINLCVTDLSIYNQSTLPNMKITPQKWFSTGWAPQL